MSDICVPLRRNRGDVETGYRSCVLFEGTIVCEITDEASDSSKVARPTVDTCILPFVSSVLLVSRELLCSFADASTRGVKRKTLMAYQC